MLGKNSKQTAQQAVAEYGKRHLQVFLRQSKCVIIIIIRFALIPVHTQIAAFKGCAAAAAVACLFPPSCRTFPRKQRKLLENEKHSRIFLFPKTRNSDDFHFSQNKHSCSSYSRDLILLFFRGALRELRNWPTAKAALHTPVA